MPNIFDLVNAKNIATYYLATPSNAIPYLGGTLFPPKKQLGLDLSWIKGSRGLPVALMPSEFDSKATLRDRIGFSKIDTEMPFFREAMRIGEKDRQELNKLAASQNEALIMPVINAIYDDVTTLINGAQVVPERMIMQLLSSGKIEIEANRLAYKYDYKMPSGHKITLTTDTDKWSHPEADIVGDIKTWQDTVEDDTGVRPTNAICTRKTWNYILQNVAIRKDMNPLGGQNIIMTDAMMKQYLETKLGVKISVYNKKFALQDGSMHLFYPDGYFTLIPDGTLGNTYYGTTPEESDLMTGSTVANVSIVNTGVAITTIKEPHPVNVETIVSEIVLPSFETIDQIFIAKVV
ncbi:major capsid protein [Paenibacillus larvae]|uniref:Major capsid protein n=3 Tax=Paenibacillus larvae TaxID=1464 RepID=A0AAP5JVY5_9BACL|nr:major capsid protein [Paenibacillus larvae]AQR77443.1 minor capsid protein E [Paenibacillus larvae subsp. larvae]AVF21529.1 putative major capsid protein [Paenibacillus larvae subsp. larvae]ETK30319.1 major capsid protein [Paenibacillus larvae subsp. larvae DSM 25719]MCY7489532.1 major capsid protein [Paenibacillus larvae]MCY9562363.1 major capsid protein [Paenibacillus larvae]